MRLEQAHGVEVWSSAGWRHEAASWLDERLQAAGLRCTGGLEQAQLRPWGVTLQVPTTGGPVWLKAAGPGTAFEVGLYELLGEVAPDRVLAPLATDVGRGWIVLPDGGIPLGGQLDGDERAEAMARVLSQYGQLQRDLAPHAGRLLDLGVADMRPGVMPERFEEALEAAAGYVERRGGDSERAALREVASLRGRVAAWSRRLADAPCPPSIDHNDLHPWNVFLDGAGRAKLYDWGDAVVAHPFASMLVPLGLARSGERLVRQRDAYLEVFADLAPHGELVESLELACRVGKIARALTWHRAVSAAGSEGVHDEWARAPFDCLVSLLDDSYLGGA